MSSEAMTAEVPPPTGLNGTKNPFNNASESTAASSTATLDDDVDAQNGQGHDCDVQVHGPRLPSPPLWTHRLSSSFSAMAEQISAASQALAQVPSDASINAVFPDISGLNSRLEAIEKAQERLSIEFEALKTQFTQLSTGPGAGMEELEKKVNDLADSLKLE